MALFGEVDLENENKGNLTEVSIEEILELHQRETSLKDSIEKRKTRAMRERGLIPHTDVPDDLYFWFRRANAHLVYVSVSLFLRSRNNILIIRNINLFCFHLLESTMSSLLDPLVGNKGFLPCF